MESARRRFLRHIRIALRKTDERRKTYQIRQLFALAVFWQYTQQCARRPHKLFATGRAEFPMPSPQRLRLPHRLACFQQAFLKPGVMTLDPMTRPPSRLHPAPGRVQLLAESAARPTVSGWTINIGSPGATVRSLSGADPAMPGCWLPTSAASAGTHHTRVDGLELCQRPSAFRADPHNFTSSIRTSRKAH